MPSAMLLYFNSAVIQFIFYIQFSESFRTLLGKLHDIRSLRGQSFIVVTSDIFHFCFREVGVAE